MRAYRRAHARGVTAFRLTEIHQETTAMPKDIEGKARKTYYFEKGIVFGAMFIPNFNIVRIFTDKE